jgi:hypothetical protein
MVKHITKVIMTLSIYRIEGIGRGWFYFLCLLLWSDLKSERDLPRQRLNEPKYMYRRRA